MAKNNPIDQDFKLDITQTFSNGAVASIARKYTEESPRLLGFLLKLDYSEMKIVTCDP